MLGNRRGIEAAKGTRRPSRTLAALRSSAARFQVSETHATTGSMTPLALVRALRPAQWTKNLFVLAPLIFGKVASEPDAAGRTVAEAVAF